MSKLKAVASRPPDGTPGDATPLDAIGRALRAHYDDLLREPLPPSFEALLSRLEAQDMRPDKSEEPSKAE